MSEITTNKIENISTTHSWDKAKEIASHIGRVHTLFYRTIKSLLSFSDKETLSQKDIINIADLMTLLKSPSFRAVIYHALKALHPDKSKEGSNIKAIEALLIFEAEELAAVIGSAYLYSKTKKLCIEKVWASISRETQAQMEVGLLVGNSIANIGRGVGIMTGAIRPLSMALLSVEGLSAFKEYRNHLHTNDLLYDLQYENSVWGCNHLQIASHLLHSAGFGRAAAMGIGIGLDPYTSHLPLKTEVEALRWQAAGKWIETLWEQKGDRPKDSEIDVSKYIPQEFVIISLNNRVEDIAEHGSSFNWMEKRAKDVDDKILEALGDIKSKKHNSLEIKDSSNNTQQVDENQKEVKEIEEDSNIE